MYVQRGGVGPPPLADNYSPYVVLVKGLKVFKIQLGERTEVVIRDRMKLYVGQVPPFGCSAST